jgi:predicted sulfurtransferase
MSLRTRTDVQIIDGVIIERFCDARNGVLARKHVVGNTNLEETNAMHKTKLLFMMVLVNAVVFLGCTAQQTSQSNAPVSSGTPLVKMPLEEDHAALAAVPRISVTEAEALVKKGEAILLDAREESAFRVGHIKGAISMPEAKIPYRVSMLPRDKKIITYCT